MKNRLGKQWSVFAIIILIAVLLIFSVTMYYQNELSLEQALKYTNGKAIIYNYESGFYDKDLYITLSKNIELPLEAKIYYTLNGDDPDETSDLYKEKIHINETTVYPIKAVVYYNGEHSDIYQNTYVLDKDIKNGIPLPIVSITSDNKNLYDYNIGIMVKGVTYDKNKRENHEEEYEGYIEGNYNNRDEEWIRPARVTMFDKTGKTLVDKNIGLGISGGTSAESEIKSLKLVSNYSDDEKFQLNFINDGIEYSTTSLVSEYDTIKLKSGGQDYNQGNIKSAIASRLAKQSNFDGITTTYRVSVFLNGNFYGIFDMQQSYSNSFLAKKFNLKEEEKIEKFKSNEEYVLTAAGIKNIIDKDLSIQENRVELEQKLDIDDMLLYYALELLMNNTDWPKNNYEMWKYTGEYDANNKYTDGRYRFLIYDTDLIWYTAQNRYMFDGDKVDKLKEIMTNENTDFVFSKLMQIEEYRNKFITLTTDLLNTTFKFENINSIIDEEYGKIKQANEKYFVDSINNTIEKYITVTKMGALQTLINIYEDLEKYFGVNEKYQCNIKSNQGVKVYWNNMEVYNNEQYTNKYYKGVSLKIKAQEYPEYTFKYWKVNGMKMYSNELEINNELILNNEINIEAISEKNNNKELLISEISAKGNYDWIKITNISDKAIQLNKYYISDNKEKLTKCKLPDVILKSEESITLNGSKNYSKIGDYLTNFSIKDQERIYIYDSINNKIVDELKVPIMSKNETYGRYKNSNTLKFFNNKNNERKVSTY